MPPGPRSLARRGQESQDALSKAEDPEAVDLLEKLGSAEDSKQLLICAMCIMRELLAIGAQLESSADLDHEIGGTDHPEPGASAQERRPRAGRERRPSRPGGAGGGRGYAGPVIEAKQASPGQEGRNKPMQGKGRKKSATHSRHRGWRPRQGGRRRSRSAVEGGALKCSERKLREAARSLHRKSQKHIKGRAGPRSVPHGKPTLTKKDAVRRRRRRSDLGSHRPGRLPSQVGPAMATTRSESSWVREISGRRD